MRSLTITLLLVFWILLATREASAFTNEPSGFREMTWGMPVGTLFSRDDFVGFNNDDKSLKYLRISDTNPIEFDSVKLYGMVFSFHNDRFWKVEMEARLLQAARLLDLFNTKYGEPSRVTHISEFSREYSWSGTGTDITLVTSLNYYDRKTADIASASIVSRKIRSLIDTGGDTVHSDQKLPIDFVEGFRGRKWGSGFRKGVIYLPLEQEPFYEYLIKGDDMVFEDVNAREIRYRFYNNKSLQKVELQFSGRQNYLKLKEACFRLFGQTSRYEQGEIRWIGKKTTVSLSFSIDSQGLWLSRLNFFGYGSQ
jgi:hypothetical protein